MLRLFRRLSLTAAATSVVLTAAALAADDFKICVDDSGDVAIEACSRVVTSGSSSRAQVIEGYRNRGVEWYVKKEYDKAIADATTAISMAKDHSPSYYLRFKAYQQKGDEVRARADLEQAIRTDFNLEAYVARAQIKEEAGDVPGAIADYKKALAKRKPKYDYLGAEKFLDTAKDAVARLSKR